MTNVMWSEINIDLSFFNFCSWWVRSLWRLYMSYCLVKFYLARRTNK